ncbi:hypothetical protein BC834DRAFT_585170 [Gloeopeniophorella convolvens]|nr:hypothetical protein BC834DRAFT_585170 [Gloeopeniophorella convolvens]
MWLPLVLEDFLQGNRRHASPSREVMALTIRTAWTSTVARLRKASDARLLRAYRLRSTCVEPFLGRGETKRGYLPAVLGPSTDAPVEREGHVAGSSGGLRSSELHDEWDIGPKKDDGIDGWERILSGTTSCAQSAGSCYWHHRSIAGACRAGRMARTWLGVCAI